MTTRAILWCGTLRERRDRWAIDGPRASPGDPEDPIYDRAAQVNGLELAFRAARARGARPRDIHACVCDDLLPQEFATTRLPATLEALQRLTRSLALDAEEDDALLFIATNHGEQRGLLTSTPVDEFDDDAPPQFLTPDALDACLTPLPGRQAVIVAACYAGQFLSLGARPGRVVLASCCADEVYLIRKDDEGACSAFLAELFAAWCGVGLSDGIPRGSLSLDDAFARATERLSAASAPNLPVRAGMASW
jgi:hypothetical protein